MVEQVGFVMRCRENAHHGTLGYRGKKVLRKPCIGPGLWLGCSGEGLKKGENHTRLGAVGKQGQFLLGVSINLIYRKRLAQGHRCNWYSKSQSPILATREYTCAFVLFSSHKIVVSEESYLMLAFCNLFIFNRRATRPGFQHQISSQMSGAPFFFLGLHGQDTHLFLCPAISASPWLQKVDVTVDSVVGKGFWSIFRVVIWLWEVEDGKIKLYILLYFIKTIPTIIYIFIK